MNLRLLRGLALACLLAACVAPSGPARSQEDEAMEVQRCIWRCQANHRRWADYEACTQRQCAGPTKKAPAASPRTKAAMPPPVPRLDEDGRYGPSETGVSAVLAGSRDPGMMEMQVEVSTPGCIGSIAGLVRPEGGTVTLRPQGDNGQTCTVTGRLAGTSLALEETGCDAFRGPACSFSGILARQGATVAAAPGTAPARWVYGDHPLIGRSAHVSIGTEVFGLSCLPGGDDPNVGYKAAIRLSPGLINDPTNSGRAQFVFTDPFQMAGFTTFDRRPVGYLEQKGDACNLYLDELRRSRFLRFLAGDDTSLSMEGDRVVMSLRQDGRVVKVGSQAEALQARAAAVVPLDGAGAAIGRLLRECRKLGRQIGRIECGSGD